MSEINVREIAEGKTVKMAACPADIQATARVRELAESIVNYTYSEVDVPGTEQCMIYAEELLDQLALMKKYGQQEPKWLAGGNR